MTSNSPINLRDALDAYSFDHAVITTFTFDARFFEDYCIENLKSFDSNGNISVIVDAGIYDQILVSNPNDRPRIAGVRYLIEKFKSASIFHPKIIFLSSKKRVRVIVSSANVTKDGITSNAEMATILDCEPEKSDHVLPIIREIFDYLVCLSGTIGSTSLNDNLQEISRECPYLANHDPEKPEEGDPAPRLRFLHNLERPLFDQIVDLAKGSGLVPLEILVTSRFFDAKPDLVEVVSSVFGQIPLTIFTQNGSTNLTTEWLNPHRLKNNQLSINSCSFEEDGHHRTLHAKLLILRGSKGNLIVSGSANFTTPGLRRRSGTGNEEVALAVFDANTRKELLALCDPLDSAHPLTDPSDLQRNEGDEEESAGKPAGDFRLREAICGDDDTLRIATEVDMGTEAGTIILAWSDGGSAQLAARRTGPLQWEGAMDTAHRGRSARESIIVHLRIGERVSSPILITNLQDIRTGHSLKKIRLVLEAQQSSQQFAMSLADIIASGDQDSLLNFLNFCDITLSQDQRGPLRRHARSAGIQPEIFRSGGSNGIRFCRELHPAAERFIERHIARLARHIAAPSLRGVPNFLHIALAIGYVVQAQIGRLMSGLEATTSPIDGTDWYEIRQLLDAYLRAGRNVMKHLGLEYLPEIGRGYEAARIQQILDPDREALQGFPKFLLMVRPRLLALRVYPGTRPEIPVFNPSNLCAPETWPTYAKVISNSLATVARMMSVA